MPVKMRAYFSAAALIAGTILVLLPTGLFGWGGTVHRFINYNATALLPDEMTFFADRRDYLSDHASDPDFNADPGEYHYIDIDYYWEFFDGSFPVSIEDLIVAYSYSIVFNNGIVPWVVQDWADSLTNLMEVGNWDAAWQIAAELGHYVADSHQPLHVTLNYNGQYTGNYGIHSRYESTMMNVYSSQLTIPVAEPIYWTSVIDSTLGYIGYVYPYVDSIMSADDYATALDANYGSTYYAALWSQVDTYTKIIIERAISDLASIWYTCWVNAGRPTLGIVENYTVPDEIALYQNYPNPFNGSTLIKVEAPVYDQLILSVFDLQGRKISELMPSTIDSRIRFYLWDGKTSAGVAVSSGVYLYRITNTESNIIKKMILIK